MTATVAADLAQQIRHLQHELNDPAISGRRWMEAHRELQAVRRAEQLRRSIAAGAEALERRDNSALRRRIARWKEELQRLEQLG
jgi:hypothetical protein